MPRWPTDSRARLVDAALGLFGEHGYAATTIDEIAARAGVTARTFFRHFGDKEEVLFSDDDSLMPHLIATILEPTGPVSAEQLMTRALTSLAAVMQPRREALRTRQRIVDTEVSLTGRELAKQARWQQAVTEALIERGFPAEHADVLSAIGFALFVRSLHTWLADDDGPDLAQRVQDALPRVRTVLDVISSR